MFETLGVRRFQVPHPGDVWARANVLSLSDIKLGYSASGPGCVLEYDETDYARLRLVLASSVENKAGSERTVGDTAHPSVASPGEAVTSRYGENLELLFLWVSSATLLQKLTALTGMSPRRRFVFNPTEFTSRQMVSGLRVMIEAFARQVDNADALISPIAAKEQQQALIVQFLLASRHNFSSFLDQDDTKFIPAHVRRAAEYIEASWDQAITIEDLVEVSGVSARALFKAFAKTYGSSPMLFVKQQRLQHARRLLTQDRDASVTDVAFTCGFSNLGHFAADYRKQFGELPSQTLLQRPLKRR